MVNLAGKNLGRYHLVEKLGEGGMASVYKAYDTRLERYVALKVILSTRLGSGNFLKRFEREAKALGRLSHPNIVNVHDYGEEDGSPYLVMEYLPGGTLKRKMGSPVPYQEAAKLIIPIARALEFAHQRNIIHRDVKPANILLTESDQPMLSDFGIAKILEGEQTMALTGMGVGIGTPEYMSPEQGQGQPVDRRADIYALGVVFYELITGRKPFQADTPMAVIIKAIADPLPMPSQFVPGLPEAVESVLFKALAKNPRDRFQDMQAFAAALEKLSIGAPTPLLTGTMTAVPPAQETVRRPQPPQPAPRFDPREATMQEAPPPPRREPPKPKRSRLGWWIAGGALLVAAVLGLGAVGFGAWMLRATATPLPTLTPIPPATRVPTTTPKPTRVPTSDPVLEDLPSDLSACYEVIAVPSLRSLGWMPLLCDTFTDQGDWILDPVDEQVAYHTAVITDGRLVWYTENKGNGFVIYRGLPGKTTYSDFGISVYARHAAGAPDSSYGIYFRYDEYAQSLYFFQVSEFDNTYGVFLWQSGAWQTIKEKEVTDAITPGDWNQIGVVGIGSSFSTEINGQTVYTFTDDSLPSGLVGLAVGIDNADEAADFEFDNLLLTAP